MKKILSVILPVLVLSLLLSGCMGQKTTSQPAGQDYESINGSLEDLIKLGKNYRCVMVAKEGDQIVSGTNYVSADKVRSDYEMVYGDEVWHSHSIVTKDWMYSWIDEMPGQATKIKISDMEDYDDESAESFEGAANYGAAFDYQCYAWSVDKNMFNPPADINFTDMSDLINQMGASVEAIDDMTANCTACEMISDQTAKEACRQSLNCE